METVTEKKFFSAGTPGSKRGYSGAPVFNYFGDLTGILIGGTIRECLDSSAEQKYASILGINLIEFRFNQGKLVCSESNLFVRY
uniref:Peptidase S1 domain-containing protein n=1 Tax=Caenorhabditis tropicalis TaxID=1561998 RepID=A0A1I7ULG1_9PELO